MKKIIPFILITLMLLTITATFMGCGNKDVTDLKNQFDELNDKFNDLSNQYNELDERVKKLETTMSLLDTVGESKQFTELKNKVTALQRDLVNNTASVTQVKSQVTEMQLALDKISNGGNVDEGVLTDIQNKINTLYGEVDKVLQFENGKEYEIKLNGVVYYTVRVLFEYHDGVVQSEQDIKVCESGYAEYRKEHFCGSIVVSNKRDRTITLSQMKTAIIYEFDNIYYGHELSIRDKIGLKSDEAVTSIVPGESAKWYFHIINLPNNLPENNIKLTFRMPELNAMTLLTLDNVWGDENGLKPPIVGTKN